MKLFFGISLIMLSIYETITAFSHHFIFSYNDFSADYCGKQYFASLILVVGGIYMIYKAGESRGKEYMGFEDFDEGC